MLFLTGKSTWSSLNRSKFNPIEFSLTSKVIKECSWFSQIIAPGFSERLEFVVEKIFIRIELLIRDVSGMVVVVVFVVVIVVVVFVIVIAVVVVVIVVSVV